MSAMINTHQHLPPKTELCRPNHMRNSLQIHTNHSTIENRRRNN